MTADERNMLSDLANKIAQTPPPPKDAEAEDFIRTKIGNRPDALYLMTQTVLIQNLALQHAQQQIQELQQRAGSSQQLSSGGSFLGGGQSAPPPPRYASAGGSQQQYAPPPPQYASAPQMPAPSATSGFLKGAAQTAAGVAAGGLAFEAINSLFSHHGYGGGFGGFGGGYGGGTFVDAPVDETIVNNYYDQPTGDNGGNFDNQNVDDSGQYDDQSYGDDGGGFDDNSGGDNFV